MQHTQTITHAELVQVAEKWLRSQWGCAVVLTEPQGREPYRGAPREFYLSKETPRHVAGQPSPAIRAHERNLKWQVQR